MTSALTRVDAHQHFWDPTRAHYPWMVELPAIQRRFGPDDLAPLLAARGIGRTILVQTRSSMEETREFLEIAATVEFVSGVVGWVDLAHPEVADMIAALRAGPGGDHLVGIRHQVHDEPDPEWLLRREVGRGLEAVDNAGLVYDLLVRTRELPAALAIARFFPSLRLVVDHAAKPSIREGVIEPWAGSIAALGDVPNVWCKLSGLVTEADWERWKPDDLVPYVSHLLDVFGSERLLFGSDWPVCLLAAGYVEVFDAARHTLADLGEADLGRVLGGNALEVYRLPD